MRGICRKIRYRLETIGVRCNSVDCWVRWTNDRTTSIGADTDTGEYRPIPDTDLGLTLYVMRLAEAYHQQCVLKVDLLLRFMSLLLLMLWCLYAVCYTEACTYLDRRPPKIRLVAITPVLSIVSTLIVNLTAQVSMYFWLIYQPWSEINALSFIHSFIVNKLLTVR